MREHVVIGATERSHAWTQILNAPGQVAVVEPTINYDAAPLIALAAREDAEKTKMAAKVLVTSPTKFYV